MDKNKLIKVSICIPTIELFNTNGDATGVKMLVDLFYSIEKQTYKNFEIIISDHSKSDTIKEECEKWGHLNISYHKNNNGIGSAVNNLNYAISKSNGDIIKPIFQDDLLYSEKTLEIIVNNIGDFNWGALGTFHCVEEDIGKLVNPIIPKYENPIKVLGGVNTISGPSVIFFKNNGDYFDENLCWLNDVEFYYRMFIKYGNPLLIKEKCILQRLRGNGLSNTIQEDIKNKEKIYVLKKHKIS